MRNAAESTAVEGPRAPMPMEFTPPITRPKLRVSATDVARIFGLSGDEVTAEKPSDTTLAETTGAAVVHSRHAEAGEGAAEGAGRTAYMYRVDLGAVRADASDRGLTAIRAWARRRRPRRMWRIGTCSLCSWRNTPSNSGAAVVLTMAGPSGRARESRDE